MVRAVLTAALLSVALGSGGASASAASNESCSTAVVDQTSKHVLDLGKVKDAVKVANKNGTDLFVRAFEKTPDGTLDAYLQKTVAACPNWHAGSSTRAKGNLVVLTFSMQRKSALLYGGAYDVSIGDAGATAIRTRMNSYFGSGDFTGGVTYAVKAVAARVDPANAAGPAAPVAPSTASEKPAAPIDWSGFWRVVLIVFVVIALLIIGLVIFFRVRRAGEQRRALERSRDKAKLVQHEAAVLFSKWDKATDWVELELPVDPNSLPKAIRSKHEQAVAQIVKLVETANARYLPYNNADPEKTDDHRELVDMTSAFMAASDEYGRADEGLEELKRSINADLALVSPEGQQKRLVALDESVSLLRSHLDQYAVKFDVSNERQAVDKLVQAAAEARQFVDDGGERFKAHDKILACEGRVGELNSVIDELASAADELDDPVGRLNQIVSERRDKLARFGVDTSRADGQFEALQSTLWRRAEEFGPTKSRQDQLAVLADVTKRSDAILAPVEKKEQKRRRAREQAELQERSRGYLHRSPSYDYGRSGGGGDAFLGGMAGGIIGSGLSSPSRGNDGDSGNSGGGISSGDWGGGSGGGDSGGGVSSGDW